jgi:predicted phage tail component-like protein
MYNFIDVNEVSENILLPSEALMLNGEFIENLIPGYKTLQVIGREALSAELSTFETGSRDGVGLAYKKYPARYITVRYQLIAESSEAFRNAFNQLAAILNVEEAELIFNDEPDKFFVGTPEEIGEVPGGTNSVIGEFVLFCADPFKYSVQEYEAEPELTDNSFLIDYNGTYKAYPTLEAEFYNEDEAEKDLTGDGDCGYVAFFNENEKIIQLGDPNETDTESYAKSQTLVSQKFNTETAWGTVAQTNWATNMGKVSFGAFEQAGSVAMKVASYVKTISPSTSGTLLSATSKKAKPNITYKVTAQTSGRTETSVNVKVTITTTLPGGGTSTTTAKVEKGAKVSLNKTSLYVSSDASSSVGTKTGTYYLWDGSVKNGRIRITNSSSNVGKSGQVTGWVKVSDLNLTTTTTTTGGATLAKGYGLKAGIQFGSGDWKYVTLKAQSVQWNGGSHIATLNVEVKELAADTTILEDIKFKVERTDEEDEKRNMKIGVLDETDCKDLELSTYTAPVPDNWYLMPDTFGSVADHKEWHGPSITRTIPADAAGDIGAKNFTFTYKQKMAIGSTSYATQEIGSFQALLVSGSGDNRKVLAGVQVFKTRSGKTAHLRFYVNGKIAFQKEIDLSLNNKYFGNNNSAKKINTVKTSTITKTGNKIQFNVGGIKKTFKNNDIKNAAVNEITFYFGKYGTKPELTYNGLYWAKFVKNNCDTYEDIPNKFSTNDVVTADCQNGEVYLNDTLEPSLGALGNDWEDFYLSPGLNQIGFSYSDWVEDEYAPKFKIRYREVFI